MTPELRELLELSAKAMGYEVMPPQPIDGEWIWCGDGQGRPFTWIPHRDKAQCFDMECALKIRIEWDKTTLPGVMASHEHSDELGDVSVAAELFEWHNNNRAKARMRASLRVAAEIGRRMQG